MPPPPDRNMLSFRARIWGYKTPRLHPNYPPWLTITTRLRSQTISSQHHAWRVQRRHRRRPKRRRRIKRKRSVPFSSLVHLAQTRWPFSQFHSFLAIPTLFATQKRKSSPETPPTIQTIPSNPYEQVQHINTVHKEAANNTELLAPLYEPASEEPETIIALVTDVAGSKDTPSVPDNEAILKVDTHAVNGGFESHGLVANSPDNEYVTDSQPNTSTDVIDTTTDATAKEDINKSDDQSTLTTPINKGPSIQENQAYDPDDGAWETVEVKPRGKRKKGGSKKASPVAAQHNNTKSSTNSTNANNANGQNNSDAASIHKGRGGGGGAARRPRRVRGDKNRNSSNNNNHQSTTIHHQQHNKLVKDVILHILDAVDVEIRAKSSEGNRSTKSNGNSNHHLSSHVVSNGGYRRHQSNGDVESSSPKLPLPSMVSNSSAKSLRDIVVGTSTVATKGGIHTEQPSNVS